MKRYILVHGAWHGGWAWGKVAERLRAAGHTVLTPDLPGHGQCQLPAAEITMQRYVDRIAKLVSEQAEPVILVGHSMAGAVIGQVAERHPGWITKLVYTCAFLLGEGETVLGTMQRDAGGGLLERLTFTDDQTGATMDDDTVADTFYNQVDEATRQWALPQWTRIQPTEPFGAPVRVSRARFGSVPRVYIKCLQDRILSPEAQQRLIDAHPCEQVFELDTDHIPQLSRVDRLSGILLSV